MDNEILKLNEVSLFNWNIKYVVIDLATDEMITLVEGQIFDFVPNTNDHIRLKGRTYKVVMRTYDFDNSIIWINLYDTTKK